MANRDFKSWFDAKKQDITNTMHMLGGVTCLLAKGEKLWISHNPEVEGSWWVSDQSNGGKRLLIDGTFEEAQALWLEHELGAMSLEEAVALYNELQGEEPETPNVVTFQGCEHLDFSTNYAAKRQQTPKGLFWMREQEPSMVQFCKKKGRIYGCESCLSSRTAQCLQYNEVTHSIEVPIAELES